MAEPEPRTDRPADTSKAGRNPLSKLTAVPRCPLETNTAEATATATTPPKRWSMLNTPEAVPMSCGATAPITASGIVGIAMEVPTPAITSGTTISA
jgi:hypothetical protein